ncbi:MAG: NADH:flavin oxidoreductase/NADH oxidase [Rhodospirillaceae bacterium]|jgi:2,4-dienoyl-CoA reductase-like NADH-dependent reductase (Old Yellow Enzyme family)
MSSKLFTPIEIGNLTLSNRIYVEPMCQYSAENGNMTDWHMMHVPSMAMSGAGLFCIEATAVRPKGRITHGCTGLYSDENEAAMAKVLKLARSVSDIPIGIQIGHAGRKASCELPWDGRSFLTEENGAWETEAPSPLPLTDGWPTPHVMSKDELKDLRKDFVETAKRADRLGLDYLELHGAHGYLLSSFMSPLSNQRDDEYGGSLENRIRLALEVSQDVRAAWPNEKPLGMKVNGSDFVDGGWTADDAAVLASELKGIGFDLITVSGGGVDPKAPIKAIPGYQMPFAEVVKKKSGITTATVGMIVDAHQAEEAVASGKVDMVALARGILFNPRWPFHAAVALGADIPYPVQYERGGAKLWKPAVTSVAPKLET